MTFEEKKKRLLNFEARGAAFSAPITAAAQESRGS